MMKPANIMTNERIVARRQQLGLGRKDAAHKIGIDYQYLWKLEEGINKPPGWDLLAKIANGLECSTDYLIGVVDDPNGYAPPKAFPRYAIELLKILELLPDERRVELLDHAQVMLDAENRFTYKAKLAFMLKMLQAVVGPDATVDMLEQLKLMPEDLDAALRRMPLITPGLDELVHDPGQRTGE